MAGPDGGMRQTDSSCCSEGFGLLAVDKSGIDALYLILVKFLEGCAVGLVT